MEQKKITTSAPAQCQDLVPLASLAREMSLKKLEEGKYPTTSTAHDRRASIVSIGPTPGSKPRSDSFARVTIESPENPNNSLSFAVDMKDIVNLPPEAVDSFLNTIVEQASIEVFGSYSKDAFYTKDLKESLLQAFKDYLVHNQVESDSGSNGSDSSSSDSCVSCAREQSLSTLRKELIRHSSNQLVPPEKKTMTDPILDHKAHQGLSKEWILKELELRDLRMLEKERALQDDAAKNEQKLMVGQQKLTTEQRKTRIMYGISIFGPVLTALATFFTAYYTLHANTNHGSC